MLLHTGLDASLIQLHMLLHTGLDAHLIQLHMLLHTDLDASQPDPAQLMPSLHLNPVCSSVVSAHSLLWAEFLFPADSQPKMHCFKAVFCYLCCWQCHHPHSTMCICPTGSSQWTRWQQSESPIVTPLPPINHIKADSSYQSTHKPDHGLTRDQRHQICSLDCVKELKHDDNLFHSS